MSYGLNSSRVPLFGLPHFVDIVRHTLVDDGAGGVSDTGTPVVLYSNKMCRITTIRPDDEEMQGYGFNTGQYRKIILPYAPKCSRDDVFVNIGWGTPPNVTPVDGTPDGSARSYAMTHPTGVETLTWNSANSQWQNGAETMTMKWVTDLWRFTDNINSYSKDVQTTWLGEDNNPWGSPSWPWNPPTTYSLSVTPSDVSYKVVWYKHQYDESGAMHHTSLVIELSDEDQ